MAMVVEYFIIGYPGVYLIFILDKKLVLQQQ